MKIKITLLFLLFAFCLNAQTKDFKLGKVSEQEIKLTQVPFEQNADAVILSEEGKMNIKQSNYTLTVKRRIKILTEKGIDEANVHLRFYSKNKEESILNIEGNTINSENGQIVVKPINSAEVYTVSTSDYYSEKRFTFPNVKVGSIIEYTYTKMSNIDYSIDAWSFQNDLPTLYSRFFMNNKDYPYHSVIIIGDELKAKYNNQPKNKEWILENISSYNKLKYVYNQFDQSERIKLQINDYHTNGKVNSSLNAWKDLVYDINSTYENYSNPAFVKEISKTISNGANETETIKNIVKYLNDNVKWDNYYSIMPSLTTKEVISKQKGSTVEMNILLMELLKSKNLDANLVLYRVRQRGQIFFNYPYINQFNSLLTIVKKKDGQSIILDASQINNDQIEFAPLEAFNNYGVVVQKGDFKIIEPKQKLSVYESYHQYDFDNGTVSLKRKDKFNGYFYDEKTDEKNVLNRFVTESLEARLDEESSDKMIFETDSYVKTYKSKTTIPNASFYTFINPLREFLKQYTFEDKNRQRKIEFNYPYLFNIQVKSKIPEGYDIVIDEKYKAHHKTTLGLEYYQEAKIKDGQLILAIQFLLPEGVYEADKYNELKHFFEKVKTESLKEVLMKKK